MNNCLLYAFTGIFRQDMVGEGIWREKVLKRNLWYFLRHIVQRQDDIVWSRSFYSAPSPWCPRAWLLRWLKEGSLA